MKLSDSVVVVFGGASGLGRATAERIVSAGGRVVIADLPQSAGARVASALGASGRFVAVDVTDAQQIAAALDSVEFDLPVRGIVHTAGRGRPQRILTKDGAPGSLEAFEDVIRINIIGTYNVLRIGAARIAREEPANGERGAIVLTSSVAAFEGQIGQIAYATSKAAIVGMTLCAARDLASRNIRVCTIAPGIFDTPLLASVPPALREELHRSIPNPRRLGDPDEYAALAAHILENGYLNGETIRLDGALRMAPA